MDDEIIAIKALLDEKMLRILQVFVNNEKEDYYLRELASKSNVPPATTYRIINRLLDLKIIELTKIKKLKIYRIASTPQADFLKKILKEELDVASLFVNKVKDLQGVSLVVVHGKVNKNKTNILVIGESVSKDSLDAASKEINTEYGHNISALSLTQDQYEQMTSMGLYSGEKKIVFRR